MFVATFVISTNHALNIKCDFKMDHVFSYLGDVYTCDKAIVNPSGDELLENGVAMVPAVNSFGDNVYGSHGETGGTDDIVEVFQMQNFQRELIPAHLSRVFINLIGLSFIAGPFKSLTSSDLEPFPKLKYLRVAGCQLKSLGSDLFRHTRHLKFIDFSGNQIAYIGDGIVNSLTELTNLRLGSNVCIDKEAYNRTEVLELAPQLNSLCIQGTCAAIPTTTQATTLYSCDAEIAASVEELENTISEKDSIIAAKESLIADKDSLIAEKDSEIETLQAWKQQVIDVSMNNGFCSA